jgi:hypothetical protein
MSKYEKAEVNLLPRAEGLLLGTIGGMELENFNREGAILTLYKTVELIREAAALLRQQGEESEVFQTIIDYFDNRADADHDGERFIPNEEMRLRDMLLNHLTRQASSK